MPKFAANLSMLYPELDFLDRFGAAARDGFKAVEYLFPYAFDAREIVARLTTHGLQQVLFNAPPGDWDAGERGLTCLPARQSEFCDGVNRALDYAAALACPRIHLMAGRVPADSEREPLERAYVENLRWAAQRAAAQGIDVLIEPINQRDIPGYFLNHQQQAHGVVSEVAMANLKIQMDLYHCQVVEGDVAMKLRQYLPAGHVGHIQIAGVPQRHEPDVGELNYPYLFSVIDELGYKGWVGCEYRPARGSQAGGTSAGLSWLKPWL